MNQRAIHEKSSSNEYTLLCPGDESGTRCQALEEDGVSGEPEVAARSRARRVSVPAHMQGSQMKAAPSMGSLIAVRQLSLEVRAESAQRGERESVRIAQLTEGVQS